MVERCAHDAEAASSNLAAGIYFKKGYITQILFLYNMKSKKSHSKKLIIIKSRKKPIVLLISTAIAMSLLVSVALAVILCNQNYPYSTSYPIIECIRNNGIYEMVTLESGDKMGRCVFSNGTVCTDVQYYSKQCY